MPVQFDAAEDVLKVHKEDGKQGSPEQMWLACQQQVLQLNATGVNFLEHTKEVRTVLLCSKPAHATGIKFHTQVCVPVLKCHTFAF
jgi:hypothetical protein